ncbi:MAG TPA: membrane or secreted protein, partial [bacterium]|nr:membrane or secreted protein [bacterium]
DKFYYSNTTSTSPVNAGSLAHIAGVGSSPIVHYFGTGAYFLDKLGKGVWRLEVMPDVMYIRDPFAKASPSREVTRVQWGYDSMHLVLPDLGDHFIVNAINEGNRFNTKASGGDFIVPPGVYLLNFGDPWTRFPDSLGEFYAPKPYSSDLFAAHTPFPEVTAGNPFVISATIAGLDTGRAFVQIGRNFIPLQRQNASLYTAEVPGRLVNPGKLTYKIILHQGSNWAVFPGDSHGDPFAWDNTDETTYSTTATDGPLEIYNPATDRTFSYPPFRRGPVNGLNGFQTYFGGKRAGRTEEFQHLYLKVRSTGKTQVKIHVTLTNADAFSYGADISAFPFFQDIEVPLDQMVP